ncbi:hypothetical protein RDABS01_000349 [Bienertia sinuspersici]
MVENGCKHKPNVYTCNILLRGLCSDGMLEKAIKLFHTWVSKGKEVDAVTNLCKEGRFEDALNLVNDMIENELGPDKYTYNAFVNAGRTAEAEEIQAGKLQDQVSHVENAETDVAGVESISDGKEFPEKINQLCMEGRYKSSTALSNIEVKLLKMASSSSSVLVFCW